VLTSNQDGLFLVVGLGGKNRDTEFWRRLGGTIARAAASFETIEIAFDVPTLEAQRGLAMGLSLGAIDEYTLKSNPKAKLLSRVVLPPTMGAVDRAAITAETNAVATTRALVNTPANLLYPELLAAEVKALTSKTKVKCEIWDVKRMTAERCVGTLAVGIGSIREPRIIKLSYEPKGAGKHLALVGKGITFDTGGLSLKPREGMAGMKYDMAGSVSVMAAILAIAELEVNVAVTAWMCVAENMPSGSATRPNDVITYRNGKSVEVMNTDAEGRLVLADGLLLASEQKPDLIVDVATLTGAATVALGKRFGAVMGNQAGVDVVMAAFARSGESAWHMPMPEELRDLLDSPIADIANAKLGNAAGGMMLGAHFLSEFVGKSAAEEQLPWAHLDIAGPANNDGAPYGYTPKGASGYSVRTLIEVARGMSE
jgi:leucyl aminopeptidase